MLGTKKFQIPLSQVSSITLGEPSATQAIEVIATETHKFLNFLEDIDDSFELIESTWKEFSAKSEKKKEISTSEKSLDPSPPPSDSTEKEENSTNVAIVPGKNVSEPPKETIARKSSSNKIREAMRQRQAKAQKQREESQAKIKAKVSTSRKIIEEKEKHSIPSEVFDSSIRFLKQFGMAFFILWICTFIIPNYFSLDTWRAHLAASIILGSMKITLNFEEISVALSPLLAAKIPNTPKQYLSLGCLLVFKILLLGFTCFLVPEMHVHGVLSFFLVSIATSSGEIARAVAQT